MNRLKSKPCTFSTSVVEFANQCCVILDGELDMDSARDLQVVLGRVIEKDPLSEIVLDLSQLTFADSSGVELLLEVGDRLFKEGRRLTVRSPRPIVLKVFLIAALTDLVKLSQIDRMID